MMALETGSIGMLDKKCWICLRVAIKPDYVLFDEIHREILEVLVSNDVNESLQSVICTNCSEMLHESFAFKSSCLYTEDSITPLIDSNNLNKLDIAMVFHKINSDQINLMPKNKNICRFCMKLIHVSFTFLKDLNEPDLEMLKKVVPEMQLEATKEPIICEICLSCFKDCFKFISVCLSALKQCNDNKSASLNINLNPVLCLKNEIKNSKEDLVLSEVENQNPSLNSHRVSHNKRSYICDKCGLKTTSRVYILHHLRLHGSTKSYSCEFCPFQTKDKGYINRHRKIIHKEPTKMFKCDACLFVTAYSGSLKRHMSIHNVSKTEIYKCNRCPFESKHKLSLIDHDVVHKKPEETKLHKCQVCQFVTKYKGALTHHELIHKDLSEVQVLQCAKCDFKTKKKDCLQSHVLLHMNVFYECELCGYKTRYKRRARNHCKNILKGKSKKEKYVKSTL